MARQVMLVEDEANILEAVRFVLARDGWEVFGHGNGATALAEIARRQPDAVVLDVMLPGLSGLEILRELRGADETATLPVLMLTAKGLERDRDTALRLGADAYLAKPFSNAELVETLRRIARPGGVGADDPDGGPPPGGDRAP